MITYQEELYVISDIFRVIVATVNQNITTDLTKTIKNINFKHGTWMQVQSELIKDSQAQDFDSNKYPAIILLHRVEEEMEIDSTFKCDILVVCKSSKDLKNDKRVIDSYKPILNPICAELISVLKNSRFFSGYTSRLKVNKVDLFHLSDGANGNNYNLPDVLDGVILQNLELTINNKGCYKLPLPSVGYTISQLDVISEVELSGEGTDTLEVVLSEALFKDNKNGKEAKYTYTIGDITAETEVGVVNGIYIAEFESGDYVLTIESILGAKFQSMVRISGGIVSEYVYSASFEVQYNLNFYKDLLCTILANGAISNTTNFSFVNLTHNGNTLDSATNTDSYSFNEGSVLSLTNTFLIQSTTEYDVELENKHIINLKQIL